MNIINENGVNNINNISYSFEEYGIEFGFTYCDEGFKSAILQLPTTPDSQHSIDSQDYDSDSDNEYHAEVFETLKDYFYNDFADVECAKASIVASERVIHVEPSNNLYVAFCESGKEILLKEGRASSYYNVFYFEPADLEYSYDIDDEDDHSAVIDNAKNAFFKSLKSDLEKKLAEEVCSEGCDSALGSFMCDRFGNEWSENEIAQEFYENIGCDCRGDAEYSLQEIEG